MTRCFKTVLISVVLVGIAACSDPEGLKREPADTSSAAAVVKMPKELMTYSDEELMLLMEKYSTDEVVLSDLFEKNEKPKNISFKGKLIIKEDSPTYLKYIDGAEISVDVKLK